MKFTINEDGTGLLSIGPEDSSIDINLAQEDVATIKSAFNMEKVQVLYDMTLKQVEQLRLFTDSVLVGLKEIK